MDKQCRQTNPKCLIILAYHGGKQGWRGKEIKLRIPQRAQLLLSMLELSPSEKEAWSTEQVAVQQPKALSEPHSVAKEEPSEQGCGMWFRSHGLGIAQQESNILPAFRCVWSRCLCPIHPHWAFLMTSRGMQTRVWFIWHLFQVSGLGLNDSHPEHIMHWLKRDYPMVDVCVININISSKEPIDHLKISLGSCHQPSLLAPGICMALHSHQAKGGTGKQKPSSLWIRS